jgi:hypothetical protein
MVDDALKIADNAEPTPGAVAKARLQVGSRQWFAERAAADLFGARINATVALSVNDLMLAALQAPPPPRPTDATPTLTDSGDASDETASRLSLTPLRLND